MKYDKKHKDPKSIEQADVCYQRIFVRPWVSAAIFLICVFGFGNAWAQDLYVDSAVGSDTTACDVPATPCETIAYTILQSVLNDTIHLVGSSAFNESGIDIPHSLTIVGEGPLNTTIDADILGQTPNRIFTVNGDATVIEGVTLLNGDASGSQGGAILLETGDLLVNKARLVDNTAGDGGAIAAVSGAGTISVLTTIISNNHATVSGGGIWCDACDGVYVTFSRIIDNSADSFGGAIFTDTAPMTSWISHLSRNSAHAGGSVYTQEADVNVLDTELADNEVTSDGGAIHVRGDLTIQRSTLAGNSAADNGGAVYFYGEGFLNSANSTWSGNSATLGGALSLISAPPLAQADVMIGTSTFYNNVSTIGAAGSHFSGTWASFGLFNSIVALTGNGPCAGITPITAGQNNLIDDLTPFPTCDTTAIGIDIGDVLGLDPNLAFNGGLTRTHLIDPSSNAVDAGLNSACLNPTTGASLVNDQRSFSRQVGAACDIGAVELQ